MSLPREVRRGTTYMVTRRCLERRFFLRPSKLGNAIFLFVLAVAARRYGIQVHLFCVMSNHYHLLLTDPLAQLPAFMQYLNGVLARAFNALLHRKDHLFEAGSYHTVELPTPADVIRESVYLLANPVEEGLVRFGHLWPGLWSKPEWVGGAPLVAERPPGFFLDEGGMPEKETLELTTPPGFASAEEYRGRLEPALLAKELELGRTRLCFLGPLKVMRMRPTDQPRKKEEREKVVPWLAAADEWVREQLEKRRRAFFEAYEEALLRWREGRRSVVFPEGTYLMRVLHGAACASAG